MTNSPPGPSSFRLATASTVYVTAEGHEPVEISVDQLTPAALARMFTVSQPSPRVYSAWIFCYIFCSI